MRSFATVLIVLVTFSSALAYENPDLRLYLDFDPPNRVSQIEADIGDTLDVYVVADCFGPTGGLRGVRFVVVRGFLVSGSILGVNLLGGPESGQIEDPIAGWFLESGADCVYPDENGIVVVARVSYEYQGGPPGDIRIIPSELDAWFATDCLSQLGDWCCGGNAGIGVEPPPGDPGCTCEGVPTEDRGWGRIKALYH